MSVGHSTPHRTDAKRGKRERVAPGVYLRAGKYLAQYVDIDGRVRFKTTSARNLTEAKAERERLRVHVRSGEAVVPSKLTLAAVAEDFFSTFESLVQAGEKSERTLVLYRQRWRSHLERNLGRLPVQSIRAEHVARVLEALRRAGLSPWTVKGIHVLLGSIFAHAMARGLLLESPLKRLAKSELPRGKAQTKARTLEHAECEELIDKALGVWRVMIATACFTGLRISELLALRWQDVSFGDGLIHVRHQLSVATGEKPARLVRLKTDAAERDIYLLPELNAMLKRYKLASRNSKETDFVFGTREGKPLSRRNASRALTSIAEKAGLDDKPLGWHHLRHTAISRLIASGLDVVEVQRQAGHSRPSVTLDIYSHEFEKTKRSEDIRAKIAAGTSIRLTQ
jgi:integrase